MTQSPAPQSPASEPAYRSRLKADRAYALYVRLLEKLTK